jgi:phosphatidylethanolamine/phosphatidyl-N-methylethanolamine N-methyltransferase
MQQQWTDYRIFWREFRRTFHGTGAVLPSGRKLAQALAHFVREGSGPRRILEVGPGTGAVTYQIVRAMRPDDRLVLVERNEEFVARLRDRLADDSFAGGANGRISLVHAGVEELADAEPFDVIISGLPLNNFSVELVERLLAKLRDLLAPEGTLSFFEYVAIRRAKALVSGRPERQRLQAIGRALDEVLETAEVRRDCVLSNVPPAWVHHVRFSRQPSAVGHQPEV